MDKEKDNLKDENFEENKVSSEKDTPISENNDTNTDSDQYYDEMEELKNIFKNELKKAMDTAENPEDEIVKESDEDENEFKEYEVEGYDPKAVSFEKSDRKPVLDDEQMCECCGEKPRGTRRNPDSPYCEDCEVLLEKYPYDWKGIVAVVVVIGIALGALIAFTSKVSIFAKMKMGDQAMAKGKVYTALYKYTEAYEYAEEMKFRNINSLPLKAAKTNYCLSNMTGISENLSLYTKESVLNLPSLKPVKTMRNELEVMFGSVELIESVLNKFDEVNYKNIIAELDKLSGVKMYLKDGEYHFSNDKNFKPDGTEKVLVCDEGWLNLYKYSAAQASSQDEEIFIKYLKAARESGNEYIKRMVTPLLASTYVGTKHYDEAEALLDEIKGYNVESTDYYMVESMLMRYRDSDTESAIRFCDDGLAKLSNLPNGKEMIEKIGYPLAEQKALNLILEAEKLNGAARISKLKEALDYAGDAHIGSATVQARDLYAIIALALDNKEVYDTLQKEINDIKEQNKEDENFEISAVDFTKDVKDYKDGKITLTEIVMSGRYDLQ